MRSGKKFVCFGTSTYRFIEFFDIFNLTHRASGPLRSLYFLIVVVTVCISEELLDINCIVNWTICLCLYKPIYKLIRACTVICMLFRRHWSTNWYRVFCKNFSRMLYVIELQHMYLCALYWILNCAYTVKFRIFLYGLARLRVPNIQLLMTANTR